MKLAALRALLRVEWRAARRQRGRAGLVLALVTVPVAAMVGGSALLETVRETPEERRAAVLGGAALRIEVENEEEQLRLAPELPQNARVTSLAHGRARLVHGARELDTATLALEGRELGPGGLLTGLLELVEGRAPLAADELALSPALAEALAATLGERVELDGRAHVVCGVVRRPEELRGELALVTPPSGAARTWLVAHPEAELLAARLRALELAVVERTRLGAPDPFEDILVLVLGGFGFFECALVIAAAFAVGVRRRQREIGLLGASGAGSRELCVALLVSALGHALVGSGIGLALGALCAWSLHPFLDGWNGRANGALEFSAWHVAAAIILGWLATLGAAVLPALGATRLSIRVALAGRRPITEGSRGWLVAGCVALAAGVTTLALGTRSGGLGAALTILVGSALAVLGFGAISPALLGGLARLAGPLPLAWRLAVRDAGRFRARNGPVVTAVLAGMSVSVMLAVIAKAVEARVGPAEAGSSQFFLDLAVLGCALTGVVIVSIATTLSGVESAADAHALRALGAAPGTLRRHEAARAAYLAGLGAWLALPAGFLPGLGLLAMAEVELVLVWPWRTFAGVAFGLPLLAFLATWCGAALRRSPANLRAPRA